MSRMLIGPEQVDAIKAAMVRARKRPTLMTMMVQHAILTETQTEHYVAITDRKPGQTPMHAEYVLIPVGYSLAISYEEQMEGICLHISMSTATPKETLPNPNAIALLFESIGIKVKEYKVHTWVEEFLDDDSEYAGRAINVVVLVEPGVHPTKDGAAIQ